MISFFATQKKLEVGAEWSRDFLTSNQTELRLSYRFICNENYYGDSCSQRCTPRDDRFGHYTCDPDGTISCLPGWNGKYCEERKQQERQCLFRLEIKWVCFIEYDYMWSGMDESFGHLGRIYESSTYLHEIYIIEIPLNHGYITQK